MDQINETEKAVLAVLVQHGSRMMPLLADARKIIDIVRADPVRLLKEAAKCFDTGGYTEERFAQVLEDCGADGVGEPWSTAQAIRAWLREHESGK